MEKNIDAECTCGDGPDVLLSINDQLIDLTAAQALKLAYQLTRAGHRALELETLAEQHDEYVR